MKELLDEKTRVKIIEALNTLTKYPLTLRRLDVEKLEGINRTYRLRIGRYRIIFYVDKEEKKIYVTHIGKRGKLY
jgi:mRNA interferase RelE/StbE